MFTAFGETTKDRDLDADALPTLADGQSHRLRRGGFQGRGRGNQQFRSAPYPQRGFRGGMSGRDSGKALIFPPRIPPANMQGGMPGTVFFAPTSRQGGLHQGMPSHRGGISDVQFPRGRVGNNITIVAAQPDESSTGKKKKKKNKKKKAAQPLIEPQKSTAPPQYNLKALRQADSNREIMDRTGIFGINQFRAQKLEVQPVQNMVSPRRPAAAFDPGNLADQFSFMQLAKPGSATGNDQAADGSTSGQKGLAASKYAC